MSAADDLLQKIAHRPWELPKEQWLYYQEWNHALFLHWRVAYEELRKLVPQDLTIDTIDGACWVSLVAFTMEKVRPRGIPSISMLSNFHEVNIRTYVIRDNKPGVYFLNIESEKYLSTVISKFVSKLPYEKARIKRYSRKNGQEYFSTNRNKDCALDTSFKPGKELSKKTDIEHSLTERYCLYFDHNDKLYRYDIHHEPWSLHNVEMIYLKTDYEFGNLSLDRKPNLIHYSPGVKMLAWQRQAL
jgi:uncharacterized protein YqjF (DUF2071 family)